MKNSSLHQPQFHYTRFTLVSDDKYVALDFIFKIDYQNFCLEFKRFLSFNYNE